MPARLRPSAPLAADAILVGDPGRALLLAQELLVEPKMSNHARGLWGYTGRTATGDELTIQSTGMGGPSAALVLADLAGLGIERAVRVGTCVAFDKQVNLGDVLVPMGAIAGGGSSASFGLVQGAIARPDQTLFSRLRRPLDIDARGAMVASLDTTPSAESLPDGAVAADMQTVAVLARAGELGIAAAALLIVTEAGEETLGDDDLAATSKRAGRVAAEALSNPLLES